MDAARAASAAKSNKIEDHYTVGKVIGTGTFAMVKQCTRKSDGVEFAVKIFDKRSLTNAESLALKGEVDILRKIKHANVVQLHEVYDSATHYYLVMECMHGGELFDRIVEKLSYTESDAAKLIAKILSALHYCHAMGIVHRDLKPENLLLVSKDDDSHVKIADFGLAKLQDNASNTMRTACGTPGYVAPEVLLRKGYSKAVDLWSTGVIAYILLCGFPPFYEENNAKLFSAIKAAAYDYPPEFWDQISSEAKDFIDHLLVKSPTARMTTEQALAHPWITKHVQPEVDQTQEETAEDAGVEGEEEGAAKETPDSTGDPETASADVAAEEPEPTISSNGSLPTIQEANLTVPEQLKKYNGIRKLQKGVQQVVIMHRMKRVKTQLANFSNRAVPAEPGFL